MTSEEQIKYHPLTNPQKAIWYTENFYPGTSIAGISGTTLLEGAVDLSLLERAVNLAIENNDAMRIRIRVAGNEPRQYVAPYAYKKIEFKDFRALGQGALRAWQQEMARTPLFAENADLYRFALLQIDDKTCGFFMSIHHIICDAWSLVMLGNEVMRRYRELKEGLLHHPRNPSYLDFIEEENAYLASNRCTNDAAFWREQFQTMPELVGIKARKTGLIGIEADRRSYDLPGTLSEKVREYALSSGRSVFAVFMGSFFQYVNRVTGSEEAVIGVPVIGRYNAKMKNTMGMFVSAVPFRFRVDSEQTYTDFVEQLSKHWNSALRRHRYHNGDILRDARCRFGEVDRLYDIVFSYQNATFEQEDDSIRSESHWHFNGCQNESLVININQRDDGRNLVIDYDYLTGVFRGEEIDRMHSHYMRLLENALDAPHAPLRSIEMISENEKALILNEFNDTFADFPGDRTLLWFFEDRAARCPDDIAVLFGGETLTYRQLNARANALARALRSKGVIRGSVVAMMLPRSFEMMIGILGIWKAGGAYLPIDPNYPEGRVSYMLDNGGVRVLLTTSSVAMRPAIEVETLEIDQALPDADETPEIAAQPGDLAYVIYTSGSTGQPKGVMVEHRALMNRIHWMNREYPLSRDDVILQKTTYTFDVSVWELAWWFYAGIKVAFLAPEAEKYPDRLVDAIKRHRITTLHFVPSMLSTFLGFLESHSSPVQITSLKRVFTSGEALAPQQVNRFNSTLGAASGARLYNLYGPTEATIEVSFYDCPTEPNQRLVPIGKPIDNIQLYVMDRHMNLQPIGIPGELCIGGIGLARGYINKPELTAEKFVPSPFAPGGRLYKTGDLARWIPAEEGEGMEGQIDCLGRMDSQVKIRGFRIELGDIKYHLEREPSVREAAVLCFDGPSGSKYLVAYYVAEEDLSADSLRGFLSKHLPEYMIPAHFLRVERIPLLSNGKANLSMLPAPTIAASEPRQIIAPRNEVEELIMRVWSDVLGTDEPLSVTDDFFKVGGDSLSAIDMVCRTPKRVRVSQLYENPILEDFAQEYMKEDEGGGSILTLLAGEEGGGRSYILCPPAGTNAYNLLELGLALSVRELDCCVYSLNLPGHDYRAANEGLISIRATATLILEEIRQRVSGSIVIYAQCVGSALGVEIARLLEETGMNVEMIILDGNLPPVHIALYGWFVDPWIFKSDETIISYLKSIGFPDDNLDFKINKMFFKVFRHDVRSYCRYFAWYKNTKQNKLSVPVISILGGSDPVTQRLEGRSNWSFVSNEVTTIKIPGAGHFFHRTHPEELAETIVQACLFSEVPKTTSLRSLAKQSRHQSYSNA